MPPDLKKKVIEVCARLGCDPSHLMAVMAFETGERFRPDTLNKVSGATGLIQFMPSTATALGTTTAELAAMSAEDQMDYVEAYFSPYLGKLNTVSDLYMAVLWPKATGKPAAYVLFQKPSIQYEQNKGLDGNKDGTVTKAEAAVKVFAKLIRGMRDDFRG